MGLFDFFRKKQPIESTTVNTTSEIPRDLFIEDRDFVEADKKKAVGIEAVYNFLLEDFEVRGYNVSS